MKNNLISLTSLVFLAGLVSLTSCKKDNLGDGGQFYGTMEQCADQHGKTVLNGSVLNWTSSDQVSIYGTAGSGLYTAQPQNPASNAVFNNVSGRSGDAPYYAIYPASIATAANAITLPATQVTEDGSLTGYPMYAESVDNHLAFKNLCGLLKLHLTKANTSISSITITASSEINGNYTVNYNGGVPTLTYVSDGSSTTTLTCTTAQAIDNGKDFYVYLPAGNYSSLSITITDNQGGVCTKSSNEGTTITVYRSQYTPISLGENDLDFAIQEADIEGALPGLFTVGVVNGDPIKVRFSQGNLQYQASTNTWRFAEHQYNFVGNAISGDVYENGTKCNNALISPNYSGWIDLFGWGTGNSPILISENMSDYNTFVDWGVNAISNGGDESNLWRTLSNEEWNYLLNTRPNASSKVSLVVVNDVFGIALLPDNWTMPDGMPSFPPPAGWFNMYTPAMWTEMEANGAVFLPNAGYRLNTSVYDVFNFSNNSDGFGYYWTSTSLLSGTNIYALYVFSSIYYGVVSGWGADFNRGQSVRLVKDVN